MKTARAIVLPLVLLVSLAFGGCDDDTRFSVRQDPVQFPMAIGMYWVYEVYDSLTLVTDTLQVSIVDTSSVPEKPYGFHRKGLSYRGEFEHAILHRSDDTVDMIELGMVPLAVVERFVFPLQPGNMWSGPFEHMGDTSVVADSEVVVTSAGVFDRTARLDRRWEDAAGGIRYGSTTWFYPSAGIVQRHELTVDTSSGSGETVRNTVQKLIRYDLAVFPRSSFPDDVGQWWRYATYDSLTESADTITVTVKGKLPPLSRDIPMTVWEIRSDAADSAIVDTLFVADQSLGMIVSGDTLFTGEVQDFFRFPQAVGRTWGMDFIVPVPDVVEKKPISVAVGDFETAFRNVTPGSGLNDYWLGDTWLAPHVGIVKRRFKRDGLGSVLHFTWELIDYSGMPAPNPAVSRR